MSFLLDTNVLSAHFRRPAGLAHRFLQHSGRLSTSAICLGELYIWAFQRPDSRKLLVGIEELLADGVRVFNFDKEIAESYARTQVTLLGQGTQAPESDLMIAATALVHDLTLVTHNVKDFSRIPGLRIVDWLAP